VDVRQIWLDLHLRCCDGPAEAASRWCPRSSGRRIVARPVAVALVPALIAVGS